MSAKAKNPLLEEIERLKAENALLKAQGAGRQFRLAVSAKGAVSMYGVRRFPITLYREEWDYVLSHASDVNTFCEANAAQLKSKADSKGDSK